MSVRNCMSRIAILLLPIALGACAQYAQYGMNTSAPPTPGPLAWDGAGRNPNLPQRAPRYARSAPQAVAQSPDDADALSAEADDNLARKLVICSTCVKPQERASNRSDDTQVANRQ
jgi:hypothetical protein